MWVTVPFGVHLTDEIISDVKNNYGIVLTGRLKNSGRYKKLEIIVSGEEGKYTSYSQNELDCLKEYFSIDPNWKLRGRK